MTTANTSTLTQTHTLTLSLSGMLTRWRDNARKAQRFERTRRELTQLTNRELADIGLTRDMIRDVAYESAYGVRPT